MKKVFSLTLALILVFSLCACGVSVNTSSTTSTQQTATTPIPASNVTTVSNVTVADPSSPEGQTDLMFKNLTSIMSDNGTNQYYYTVTDLDHNGRLEFIAALTSGDASNTTGKILEVNPQYNGFTEVNMGLNAGEYLPEVIVTSTECYKDSSNVYHYIFTDTTGVGYGDHYESKYAVSLQNGSIVRKVLAHKDIAYVNGITVVSYIDSNGRTVEDVPNFDFNNVAASVFPGASKSTVNFDWCKLGDITSSMRLLTSYSVFNGTGGTGAPIATPVPAATPTPTSSIWIVTDPTVTITKNPTSETVTEYGSCKFVANATGFNSVRWELVSPYGQSYDARYNNPFPGSLLIYGASDTILTLSNIPLNMSGWGARAIFEGNKNTATSTTAYVTVTAQPAPVYTTISFSPGSGSYFTDTYQYVTVYSSNGQPIRVEATMSGDTGAYYSDTISSGSGFPVKGISGQCVTVAVVATCGASQQNAYFTVDCTPIPPQPTYTPPTPTTVPGGQVKHGYVSDVVVTEDGDTFIAVNFDDGSYGRYDITYMCSNPPSVGQRCICSFGYDGYTLTNWSWE